MAPRSRVWEFFTRFTDGSDGKAKAECNKCRLVLGADTRSGTSTLWAHVRICWGDEVADAARAPRPPPLPCAPPSRTSCSPDRREPEEGLHDKEVSGDLARMIALHGYDPSFVEDDYFRSFVRRLNPDFEVPSREAVEEMCDGIFDEARMDILSRIRNIPGRVSLAVGTVRMEKEVLYTACHFIDGEWNLHKVIMDAYVDGYYGDRHGPLLGVHQAPLSDDIFEIVMDDFQKRGVLGNIFMTVWDHGSGDHICLHLRDEIAHTKYNANPRMTEPIISTSYMDKAFRSIALHLLLDTEFDGEMTSEMEGLHLTRKKRQKLLSQLGLDYNLWSYDEDWYYWYSSYCSLQVLRNQGFTGMDAGPEFAELVCKLCGKIYRAIQRVSASSCPTSHICLVELFELRELLQSQIVRASGDNAIDYHAFRDYYKGKHVADVLREAMDELDKSIKDSYLVWSIPLILDPRYKLEFIEFIFRRAYVSEAASYISEVTRQIKVMYVHYLEYNAGTSSVNSDHITAMAAGSSADPLQQAWDEHCRLRGGMTTEVTPRYQDAEVELDRYLKDPLAPQTESFDILKWWKDNSWNYPTVAQMARDALAMPTCSKLSPEQMAHVRSILRGYSKAAFRDLP